MKLLLICFVTLSLWAQQLPSLKYPDQFEKNVRIKQENQYLLVSFSKETSEPLNPFVKEHADLLKENNTVILLDVSPVPALIFKLFVLPKIQQTPFSYALNFKEEALSGLQQKEGFLSLYHLKNKKIVKTEFLKPEELLWFFGSR